MLLFVLCRQIESTLGFVATLLDKLSNGALAISMNTFSGTLTCRLVPPDVDWRVINVWRLQRNH